MTIKFKPANGFTEEQVILPKRQTLGSNGYDFYATKDVTLNREKEGQKTLYMVSTGVTADFPSNVVLLLFNRSSNPGRGLIMPNGVGVVDSDYSQGTNNEIKGLFYNASFEDVHIKKGDRIFQGVFVPSLLTDDDNPEPAKRESGFGSTGNDVDDKGTFGEYNEDNLTHNVKVLLENYHKGQATADYELDLWGERPKRFVSPQGRKYSYLPLPKKDVELLDELGYEASWYDDMGVDFYSIKKVHSEKSEPTYHDSSVHPLSTENEEVGSTCTDSDVIGTACGYDKSTLSHNVRVILENYRQGQPTADYELTNLRAWGNLPKEDEMSLSRLGYKIRYYSDIASRYVQVCPGETEYWK